MRSFDPNNKYEQKELAKLNAEDWMVKLLDLNPEYTCWGPYEDYMSGNSSGWSAPKFYTTWQAFTAEGWSLDELNECVNFYFEVERSSVPCTACDQSGSNPETKALHDSWYDLDSPGVHTGWMYRLEQEDVDALVESNRLWDLTKNHETGEPHHPTAAEVNAWARGRGMGHDSINCWICVEARAKRQGVWGKCEICSGEGHLYTEPKAHVNLVLWMIHPRKGCGKGIEIKNIPKSDLVAVKTYLQEAQRRNNDRFKKLDNIYSFLL